MPKRRKKRNLAEIKGSLEELLKNNVTKIYTLGHRAIILVINYNGDLLPVFIVISKKVAEEILSKIKKKKRS